MASDTVQQERAGRLAAAQTYAEALRLQREREHAEGSTPMESDIKIPGSQGTRDASRPDAESGPQLRAFLASMRTLRGCADLDDDDIYQVGRAAIERLAAQADDGRGQTLTLRQASAVLRFLQCVEPVESGTWWDDEGHPSHLLGYYAVLRALRSGLSAVHVELLRRAADLQELLPALEALAKDAGLHDINRDDPRLIAAAAVVARLKAAVRP